MIESLGKNEIEVLNFIVNAPSPDIDSISSTLHMKKAALRRSLSLLTKLGLIEYTDVKKRSIEITSRGKFFLEKGDIRIATGYPPNSTVPDYVAFKFALGEGIMTGDVAHSYEEFLRVIERVDSRSLIFHLYRGDFDAWFSEVFRDRKISASIARLKARQSPPNKIRDRLIRILQRRINEVGRVEGH